MREWTPSPSPPEAYASELEQGPALEKRKQRIGIVTGVRQFAQLTIGSLLTWIGTSVRRFSAHVLLMSILMLGMQVSLA